MRRLSVGAAAALLLGVACNLHLDASLIPDPSAGHVADLTGEEGGVRPSLPEEGGVVVPPAETVDAGADAGPSRDAGDAGASALCPANGAREREPNDTVLAANGLPLGAMCGRIDAANDTDWYTFELGDDGMLRLEFDAEADARILAYNADASVSVNGATGFRQNFKTTPGRWTVYITSPTTKPQGYVIRH